MSTPLDNGSVASPSNTNLVYGRGTVGSHPKAVTQFTQLLDELDRDVSGDVLEVSAEDFVRAGFEDLLSDTLNNADVFLHLLSVTAEEEFGIDHVHFVGELPEGHHKRIEDIRAADNGSLVSVECRVTDRTEATPELIIAALECQECGNLEEITQSRVAGKDDKVTKPRGCPKETCGAGPTAYELIEQRSEYVDSQQAIVQDRHELSSSAQPEDIKVVLHNDLVGTIEGGDSITLTAIVRTREDERKLSELSLQAVGIEHQDTDYSAVDLDEEDVEKIEDLAEDPEVYDILSESIAPSIKGDYQLARMAALYQLFGGVDHSSADEKYRPDIHVSYVGDPGTGKSAIGRFTTNIAPTSVYQSADNVTQVGLTAAVTHEERLDTAKWTVSGGALVRADGGHCVIDELDKAPEKIQGSLQEPLSEQQVGVSKSSISATLPARCSVLLIANPMGERFDEWGSLAEQIDVKPAIWDRLDIIVPFRDKPNEETDAELADAILDRATGDTPDHVSADLLTKYVAYARATVDPVLSEEAKAYISSEWQRIRSNGKDGRVTVGARQLNSFVRIAEASARIRLSDTVEMADAERAVHIMETWMTLLMTDEQGMMDVDSLSGDSYSDREREALMWNLIDDLDDGDGAPREDVVERMVTRGIDRAEAQNTINAKTGSGDITQEKVDGEKLLIDTRGDDR